MGSMLSAKLAILLQFQSIRIISPVLIATVVPVLALDTLQRNPYPHPVTPPALINYYLNLPHKLGTVNIAQSRVRWANCSRHPQLSSNICEL